MTTIAIKDGIISYDSQITQGSRIASTKYDKKTSVEGYHFFSAGSVSDIEKLISLFFNSASHEMPRKGSLEANAFIVTPERDVYMCGFCDDELWTCSVDYKSADAIGSGSDYAIGAMDAGLSSKEAVKIASNRDIYTGGRIRTFVI